MINFDNTYLVIFYLIFGLPGAIVRFSVFNLLALFQLRGFKNVKDLWTKDEIIKTFIHPYNLLIGLTILILILVFT